MTSFCPAPNGLPEASGPGDVKEEATGTRGSAKVRPSGPWSNAAQSACDGVVLWDRDCLAFPNVPRALVWDFLEQGGTYEQVGQWAHTRWDSPYLAPLGPAVRESPWTMSVRASVRPAPPWHNYGRAFSSDEAGDGPGATRVLGDWIPVYIEDHERHVYLHRVAQERRWNPPHIELPGTWTTEYEAETDTLYYVDERTGWMQYTRPTAQTEEEEGGSRPFRLPPGWQTAYHPTNVRHIYFNNAGRVQNEIPGEDMPDGWTCDYDWKEDRAFFIHLQTDWWQWESPRGDLLPHTLLPGWETIFSQTRPHHRRPYFYHTGSLRRRFDIPGYGIPGGWTYEYEWNSSRVYYVNFLTERWQWEKPTLAEREGCTGGMLI